MPGGKFLFLSGEDESSKTQVSIQGFTLRVYGIFINHRNELLLSDEFVHGREMTKFPGGGVQPGEGITDALHREWMEELGVKIIILEHFYTCDFFQVSAFDDSRQVISIYYRVRPIDVIEASIKRKPFDFEKTQEGAQAIRWIQLKDLSPDELTFPIDKKVAGMLGNG